MFTVYCYIFSCVCLNYYGITWKVCVGEVGSFVKFRIVEVGNFVKLGKIEVGSRSKRCSSEKTPLLNSAKQKLENWNRIVHRDAILVIAKKSKIKGYNCIFGLKSLQLFHFPFLYLFDLPNIRIFIYFWSIIYCPHTNGICGEIIPVFIYQMCLVYIPHIKQLCELKCKFHSRMW